MTTKTKSETLTAQDLALYLGCSMQFSDIMYVTDSRGCNGYGKVGMITTLDVHIFQEWANSDNPQVFKPNLRPLSDITEEELNGWYNTEAVSYTGRVEREVDMEESAYETLYLIRLGFDVFGWIDKGLAIDKTELLKTSKAKADRS